VAASILLVNLGLIGPGLPVAIVPVVFGGVVLAPMMVLVCFAWWSLRGRRVRGSAGLLAIITLFFTLSTALLLFPLDWVSRFWVLLALGIDLLSLGLAIAYFDAFEGLDLLRRRLSLHSFSAGR
jgi:hypothetical protein